MRLIHRRAPADRRRSLVLLLDDLSDLHMLDKEVKRSDVHDARHLGRDDVAMARVCTSRSESLLDMVATEVSHELPEPRAWVDRYDEKLVLVPLSWTGVGQGHPAPYRCGVG